MPSGKTHDRITYLAALPAALASYALHPSLADSAVMALGVLTGGLAFGPDLDVKSVQYYRWGPLRWIWWPYQRMFRHRSPWTHGPLLGLAVRILYLAVVTTALTGLGVALWNTYLHPVPWHHWALTMTHPAHLLATTTTADALAGLWLGGALHTWADHLVSGWRRWVKPTRKRR